MLTQQPPFICGHHGMPRNPFRRLRIGRRRNGLHGLLITTAVERFLHAMLSAHETAIEAFSGLL